MLYATRENIKRVVLAEAATDASPIRAELKTTIKRQGHWQEREISVAD